MNGPRVPDGAAPVPLQRLLVVVTGSVSASDVPFWVEWTTATHPDLELRVVLTRAARELVSPASIAARLRHDVEPDTWPAASHHAPHVEWNRWAQAVLVYPATFSYLARLANGMADTPSLLAAQCTTAPLVLAPALPPGGMESPALQQHWRVLVARRNVALLPPRAGSSGSDPTATAWAPGLFPHALELVEQVAGELAGTGAPDGGVEPTRAAVLA